MSDMLATLDERDKNRIQIDKVKQQTVEPGVMKLPVSTVTKAENSEKWVFEIEHPIEGSHRLYRDAPTEGWDDNNELIKLLNWYNVESDPYQFQTRAIYVAKKGSDCDYAHGWDFIAPPDYEKIPDPMTDQLKQKFDNIRMPEADHLLFYLIVALGVTFGAANATGSTVLTGVVLAWFFGTSILAMMAFGLPGDDT